MPARNNLDLSLHRNVQCLSHNTVMLELTLGWVACLSFSINKPQEVKLQRAHSRPPEKLPLWWALHMAGQFLWLHQDSPSGGFGV